MGQAGELTMGGRENGNAMRFNRKATFVLCTVGKVCTYPTDSIRGKTYTLNIQTEICERKEHVEKVVFFKDRYLTLPYLP